MSDSEEQIQFETLYILILPGRVIVTKLDPRPIQSEPPYAIIEVDPTPNGNIIRNLHSRYVYGPNRGEYIETTLEDFNLRSVFSNDYPETDSVLDIVLDCYRRMINSSREKVIHPTEPELNGSLTNPETGELKFESNSHNNAINPLSFPGDTETEQFINSFMTGIASNLSIFGIIRQNQTKIGSPFHPVIIQLPDCPDDNPESYCTRKVGKYLSFYTRLLQAICRGNGRVDTVGCTWLSLIDLWWRFFSRCFCEGTVKNPYGPVHDTVVGFCLHQNTLIQQATQATRQMSEMVDSKSEEIRDKSTEIVDKLNNTIQAMMEQQLKDIDAQKTDISEALNSMSDDHTRLFQQVEVVQEAIQQSKEDLLTSTQDELEKSCDHAIGEVQSVYTECNQNLQDSSKQISEELFQMENRLNSNMNQQIQTSLADVKQVCQDTLSSVSEKQSQIMEYHQKMVERSSSEIKIIQDSSTNILEDKCNNSLTELANLNQELSRNYQEQEVTCQLETRKLKGHVKSSLRKIKDSSDTTTNKISELKQQFLNDLNRERSEWQMNSLQLTQDVTDRCDVIFKNMQENQNGLMDSLVEGVVETSVTDVQNKIVGMVQQVVKQTWSDSTLPYLKRISELEQKLDKTSNLESRVMELETQLQQTITLLADTAEVVSRPQYGSTRNPSHNHTYTNVVKLNDSEDSYIELYNK